MANLQRQNFFCYLELAVLKILKRISNIIVWTVLGLYVLLFIGSKLTVVQEYMGSRIASLLAEKLGTSVSIGSIDIGVLNHLTMNDVSIKDQQGKDMLWCSRVSARLDLLPLTEGKIAFTKAQLFGSYARLYRENDSAKINCQFVIDSLASKDTTSNTPLDLRINSLIIRHTSVSYDCLDAPKTPGKLNLKHLWLKDISTHIVLKTLREDSVDVHVKRLALKEQSGLKLDRLAFDFQGGRQGCRLTDFNLRMPGTNVTLGDIIATYRFRDDHFVTPSLKFNGSIAPSTITLSDMACLLPSLSTFQSTLSLSADVNGQGETIHVPHLMVSSTTGDIGLNMTGWVKEIRQENPSWTADIQHLDLSAKTINFISENLKGEKAQIPDFVNRMGNIHLRGKTAGQGLQRIITHNQMNTDAGNITLNMEMDEKRHFKGDINTQGINLKRLTDNNSFGQIATLIALHGTLKDEVTVHADGTIRQFDYNGYQYKNIKLNGLYSKNDINGELSIDDENVVLDIEGHVKKKGRTSNVLLNMTVDNLSPKELKLSEKWGDARFGTTIKADFTASSLNDAIGSLDVNNLTMASAKEHYTLQQLHIESDYTDDIHQIRLDSDFGKVEIRGDFDYETLPQSFTNFLASRLPSVPGIPKVNPRTKNNFVVAANIQKADWLRHLLQIPVTLTRPLQLQGRVNDKMNNIELFCIAPMVYYEESGYANGLISLSSPGDTLLYNVKVTKLMDDGEHFDLHAVGNAAKDNLFASFIWDNHSEEAMNGQLNATISFERTMDNKQTAYISIEPSQMRIRSQQWDIEPSLISYSKNHVGINNFCISNDQQFLKLNGTASESAQDSINIEMRDIDIEYVLDLVNFDAVDFSGKATGGGQVRGLFGELQADAELNVKEFKFEHGRMGTLDAEVNWNKELEQIDIQAIADDGEDAKTYIDGYVSPARNYIDLGIRAAGTHLDFAQSFTSSFLSSVKGHGNGAVRLEGPLDAINLTGELAINGKVHVTTLGCDYELRNDTIRMIPNEIEFVSCPIYDMHNHRGTLTGGIHHKELTDMTYDIYVEAQNLLAYDFRDFGENTFYGTVFADGQVGIHGHHDGSVLIEADVTPLRGSEFVYNAASPDAINDQQFIEWNKPETVQVVRRTMNKQEAEDDFRSDLTMRLKINATPNATLRLLMDPKTNDYIMLRGNGELHTTFYNKGGFNMFGTYRVTDGTYGLTIQNIIKKNFIFKEGGTIVFGGDPYDATLNMQAQHTVNGVSLSDLNVGRSFSSTVRVNCLMNITGQPRAPIIDFDLDIPNVNSDEKQMVRSIINGEEEMNQQVVYLLAVGRFYPQGANNATDSENSPSKTSLAMQSLLSGTISGQINSLLGQVIKSNNWNFGANISTGDEGWNNAEYEGLISGRLLNNRLLINGQFGYRDNATTANTSFIGDFDIRYLLFPNGNLALKVYNQTNERYFTKSSLNTQGLGIILKKDFDGFRDLFGIRKKKAKKQEEPQESTKEDLKEETK